MFVYVTFDLTWIIITGAMTQSATRRTVLTRAQALSLEESEVKTEVGNSVRACVRACVRARVRALEEQRGIRVCVIPDNNIRNQVRQPFAELKTSSRTQSRLGLGLFPQTVPAHTPTGTR